MTKPKGGLTAWFGKGPKGDWVDISAPKKKVFKIEKNKIIDYITMTI